MKKQTPSKQAYNEAIRVAIELARQQPPRKPTPLDRRIAKARARAQALDKELEPAVNAIYRHLSDQLQGDDRELFALYPLLCMGSTLSRYAPMKLVSPDLTFGDYIKLYTTWARKAQKLLQAIEAGEKAPAAQPGQKRPAEARTKRNGR
jgi:hypothetical protein